MSQSAGLIHPFGTDMLLAGSPQQNVEPVVPLGDGHGNSAWFCGFARDPAERCFFAPSEIPSGLVFSENSPWDFCLEVGILVSVSQNGEKVHAQVALSICVHIWNSANDDLEVLRD